MLFAFFTINAYSGIARNDRFIQKISSIKEFNTHKLFGMIEKSQIKYVSDNQANFGNWNIPKPREVLLVRDLKNQTYKLFIPSSMHTGFFKILTDYSKKYSFIIKDGFLVNTYSKLSGIFSLLFFGAFIILIMIYAQKMITEILSGHSFTSNNQDLDVCFEDIAGYDEVKEKFKDIWQEMKNENNHNKTRGILLTGDPGVGKTMFAKALANEIRADFYYCTGADFVEMYVGVGAKRVRSLFRLARKSISIIFIDELDAIGSRDSMSNDSERLSTINALLAEMDGMNKNNKILLIGATNHPEKIDSALKRPGRIDLEVHMHLPNPKERLAIFKKYFIKFNLNKIIKELFSLIKTAKQSSLLENTLLENTLVEQFDCSNTDLSNTDHSNIERDLISEEILDSFVKRSQGYSGAQIKNWVMHSKNLIEKELKFLNSISEANFQKLLAQKNHISNLMATKDLNIQENNSTDNKNINNKNSKELNDNNTFLIDLKNNMIKSAKYSSLLLFSYNQTENNLITNFFSEAQEILLLGTKREPLSSIYAKRTAVHELGHALAYYTFCPDNKVEKVSIESRGNALGFTLATFNDEQIIQTKEQILSQIIALLSGRAAEEIVFGDVSSGAGDDLKRANILADKMVRELGMGDKNGLYVKIRSDYMENIESTANSDIQTILESQYKKSIDLMVNKKDWIIEKSELLLKRGMLNNHELFDFK